MGSQHNKKYKKTEVQIDQTLLFFFSSSSSFNFEEFNPKKLKRKKRVQKNGDSMSVSSPVGWFWLFIRKWNPPSLSAILHYCSLSSGPLHFAVLQLEKPQFRCLNQKWFLFKLSLSSFHLHFWPFFFSSIIHFLHLLKVEFK